MDKLIELLPADIRRLTEGITAGFGVPADIAALLAIEAAAFASGDSHGVRIPDGRRLGPGFNLALVSAGNALEYGALTELLNPVKILVGGIFQHRELHGPAATQIAYEEAVTKRDNLEKLIANQEAELKALTAANARADKLSAEMTGRIEPKHLQKVRDTGYDFEREPLLGASLCNNRKLLAEILEDIEVLEFGVAPGILAAEPHWNDLTGLRARSFDRTVLATMFSPGKLREAALGGTRKIRENAVYFRESQFSGRGLNLIVQGTEHDYCRLFQNAAITDCGLFATFLFVDSPGGSCSSVAIREVQADSHWPDRCWAMFDVRQKGVCNDVTLADDGFGIFNEFRRWCAEYPAGPEFLQHIRSWPDLCMRLSLIIAILHGKSVIESALVEGVAKYLMAHASVMSGVLDRLSGAESPEYLLNQRLEKICRKLRNNPLTLRGIVRCFHSQDYAQVEATVAEGSRRGRIFQEHGVFFATNVSVSASAA